MSSRCLRSQGLEPQESRGSSPYSSRASGSSRSSRSSGSSVTRGGAVRSSARMSMRARRSSRIARLQSSPISTEMPRGRARHFISLSPASVHPLQENSQEEVSRVVAREARGGGGGEGASGGGGGEGARGRPVPTFSHSWHQPVPVQEVRRLGRLHPV